jgi:hypothetical protein
MANSFAFVSRMLLSAVDQVKGHFIWFRPQTKLYIRVGLGYISQRNKWILGMEFPLSTARAVNDSYRRRLKRQR